MTRRAEARLRLLRLKILEVPWNPEGRAIVQEEMDEMGWERDDLFVALRNAGWGGSSTKVGRWLRGENKPSGDELGLLTYVLAGYSGNWPKASNLSSPQADYSFWGEPVAVPA